MPSIECTLDQDWQNYHGTRKFRVSESYRYLKSATQRPDGPQRFAATARVLMSHLAALRGSANAGLIGGAWSLNELVGCTSRQLETTELDGISWVEAPHLHHKSKVRPREAVFVNGGASWQALVKMIESDPHTPRSIHTCGSYLNQSIAGSVATSTAGSRLGYGGVQNQVLGIHLITGPESSAWIERKTRPVLGHVAADFADKVVRNDRIFEDCLVHLGGMGVVNGFVIDTAPPDRFTMLKTFKPVDENWLKLVRDGEFASVAAWLGYDLTPAYYEVQIDPFAWEVSPAIHTMYFHTRDITPPLVPTPNIPVAELLGELAAALAQLPPGDEKRQPGFIVDCNDATQALVDLFAFYASCLVAPTTPTQSAAQTWGELHNIDPKPGQKELIYSAAFAVPRANIDKSLPIMCAAVTGRPRQFLYTLRFVTGAVGSLAFARFGENVILDFEGLKISDSVEKASRRSLDLVHNALCEASICFSPHWGKMGAIDPAKIERDFGPRSSAKSPLARWLKTRDSLLTTAGERLLWNDALVKWRLV